MKIAAMDDRGKRSLPSPKGLGVRLRSLKRRGASRNS